jgi:hypothetical protein
MPWSSRPWPPASPLPPESTSAKGSALLVLDREAAELLLAFERDLEPRLAAGSGDLAHLAGWPSPSAPTASPAPSGWPNPVQPPRRPRRRPSWPLPQGHRPRACPGPAGGAWLATPHRRRPIRPQRRPTRLTAVPHQPPAIRHRTHKTPPGRRFCGFCGSCGAWRHLGTPPMSPSSSVTLSSYNGPSLFWPGQASCLAASGAQRPAQVPRRPSPLPTGPCSGGKCGPLTPIAAPPRWRQLKTASGVMSGPGSTTAPSSGSARPIFAAGKPARRHGRP